MNSSLTLSWRVGVPKYETDSAFEMTLAFIKANHPVVDEIALFDSFTHHLYIPLEDYARRAERMGKCLRALKEAGVLSTGINVLATMGHINEAWDTMPPLPFQPMVGHDGKISTGCACPNTLELRQYVKAKYRLVAEQAPDFIWVDDDIRIQHHGVDYPCFCPTCLELISKTTGTAYTREALVQALNEPSQELLRRAWIKQNIRSIESLLADIEQTVHAVNPEIKMGLMTAGPGWTTYSGQAFWRWFPVLQATKARPGGGFYSDLPRMSILDKTFDVGRQRADLPPEVTDCQYELENFPYQMLNKSAGSVMNECTLALAVGLNGIAFNALSMWEGTLEESEPIAKKAVVARPVWEELVAHSQGLPTAGLWTAWSPQLMARRKVNAGEDWFAFDKRYDFPRTHVLAHLGLPLSVDYPATGTVFYGRMAEPFNDEELRAIFSGGVLMDSETLDVLDQRGLAYLTGVRIRQRIDNGAMEHFTDDALNGRFAGERRDARIEFWGDARGMADVLEPVAEGVRVLAELEDYFKRPKGACLTLYENELGGRVAVMGYAPWMFLYSLPKRTQLLKIADWVTRNHLPVCIDEAVTLTPIMRLSKDQQRGTIVLLNWGLDAIKQATLHLRVATEKISLLTPGGTVPLEVQCGENGCTLVLKDIPAWTTLCLLIG